MPSAFSAPSAVWNFQTVKVATSRSLEVVDARGGEGYPLTPPGPPALTTGWGMTPGWGSTTPTRSAVSFTLPSSALPNDLVQRSRICREPATARAGGGRVQRVSEIGASRYGEVGDPAATRDRSSVTSLALPRVDPARHRRRVRAQQGGRELGAHEVAPAGRDVQRQDRPRGLLEAQRLVGRGDPADPLGDVGRARADRAGRPGGPRGPRRAGLVQGQQHAGGGAARRVVNDPNGWLPGPGR